MSKYRYKYIHLRPYTLPSYEPSDQENILPPLNAFIAFQFRKRLAPLDPSNGHICYGLRNLDAILYKLIYSITVRAPLIPYNTYIAEGS